jgi:hypothetical protein
MTTLDVVILSSFTVGLMALFTETIKKFILTIPGRLWAYALAKLTLTVTFRRSDQGFDMVKQWLAAHPYAQKARQVKMTWSHEHKKYVMVPGHGRHIIWHARSPVIITYGVIKTEGENNYWSHRAEDHNEFYQIQMLSSDHRRMESFLEELAKFRKEEESGHILVYNWSGNWQGNFRRKRDMNTVYMPGPLKQRIIDDFKKFIGSEKWYVARGVPYRRGYLLHGPPGTGKTTLATGLAGYFNRSVYCMNLNSIGSDESLINAFSHIPNNGIVLIEDVDAFEVSQRRSEDPPEESPVSGAISAAPPQGSKIQEKKKEFGVTVSGLLNAIDGIAATEGRILILTTNHPEKLDPALVRSGRVDMRIEIGPLDGPSVEAMLVCFFPEIGNVRRAQIRKYADQRIMTAANWQELFIRYHDSEDRLFDEAVIPNLKG